MLTIKTCKYIDNYRLNIIFNNNESGIVDLQNEVSVEPYLILQDKEIFKDFFIDHGAICWLNGEIDMAIEYLFFLMRCNEPIYHNMFKQWGYC